MAYSTPETNTVGDAVTKSKMDILANNSVDHETRINTLETGGSAKVNIFNEIIDLTPYRVGEIRASILTESQFQARYGTDWVLMTGQSIAGADLASLYGSTLPDAKTNGRFPRQTDSDANIGTTQASQNLSHGHSVDLTLDYEITSPGSEPSIVFNSASGTVGQRSNGYAFDLTQSNEGGSEARPEALKVNYFIRKNDQPLSFVKLYRAPAGMSIVSATISTLEVGSAGSLSVDLKKGSALSSMASILSSDITISYTSGANATSSEASFSSNTLSQNDFLSLDVSSTQTGQYRFFVSVYAEAT